MSYPIKTCVVCGEEFELKPGKPGSPIAVPIAAKKMRLIPAPSEPTAPALR